MRADRLLALLMLLQARGRMTARDLARELEVSERTIYRDLDALSSAGVPVYAERGPGGGCALIEGYRTSLTGLTRGEVQALFTLNVPAPLTDLGLHGALQSALLKLSASLPTARQDEKERVRERILLDPEGGAGTAEPVPFLRIAHQAVWEDRTLVVRYRLPFGTVAEWQVEPYGLVARAGAWFLLCSREGRVRVLRVARFADAWLGDGRVARPAPFELATFWQAWQAETERNRPVYPVRVRVRREFVSTLVQQFGPGLLETMEDDEGIEAGATVVVTLPFEELEPARARILGFGRAVEVLEPRALRESVKDYAEQIAAMYRGAV